MADDGRVHMHHIGRLGLTVALAAIALAAFATTASASTQPAAGTFTEGPETILEERQAGGNLIIELACTLRGHGELEGLASIGGAYQGQAHCD